MSTTRLSVKGMHCEGCVTRVQAALENVDGVRRAEVSLDEEEATVEADGTPAGEALVRAVEDAGYEASLEG